MPTMTVCRTDRAPAGLGICSLCTATLEARLTEAAAQIRRLEQGLEQARREAVTDGLTGLANRRGFDQALSALTRQAEARGQALSLLLIDIDHFKTVNDHHGHPAGDVALRDVAAQLRHTMRQTDVVARYGGEEFAALLPGTDAGGALILAETLRRQVAGRRIACGLALPLALTISVGVAAFRAGEPAASCLGRADDALYACKRAGRNRVSFAGLQAPVPLGGGSRHIAAMLGS